MTIVIEGVQVIDGTGDQLIRDQMVTIVGDRIVAVGPRTSAEIPPGTEVISGRGCTALPGLIDVHVHDFSDTNMALYVKNGVTSIRFAGGHQGTLLDLKKRIEAHQIPGPRVFSVGPSLDSTPHAWPGSVVDSPIEARGVVRRLVQHESVDAILATHKISRAVLEAIVETAHDLGVPVTGQLWEVSAREAVSVGIDGLENTSRIPESDVFPLERIKQYHSVSSRIAILLHMWAQANWERTTEVAHLLAEQGVFLAPEIVSFEAWAGLANKDLKTDRDWPHYGTPEREKAYHAHNSYISQHWSEADFKVMKKCVERFLEFCKAFHQAGGFLVTGTDLGFGGIFIHREIQHFLNIGLSPLQVIRSATRQAASALGCDDLGYLAPGRLADIIVVEGDPSQDLKTLRNVKYAIIGGQIIVREGGTKGAETVKR